MTPAAVSHWIIVPAAGSGKRMAAERPKQYLPLLDCSVLGTALRRLAAAINPRAMVIALSQDDPFWPSINKPDVPLVIAAGGVERCHSVLNALQSLQGQAADDDWIWVHDAARPCVRSADLQRLAVAIASDPVGGLLAARMTDTVKRSADNHVEATVDRSTLWRALTPQVFRYGLLLRALSDAVRSGCHVTDEAQAVELQGLRPQLVACSADNIKITAPGDLELAEFYLRRQAAEKVNSQ